MTTNSQLLLTDVAVIQWTSSNATI